MRGARRSSPHADARKALDDLPDTVRRLLAFRPAATVDHLRRVAAVARDLPDDVVSDLVERLRDEYIARKLDESLRRVARR